MNPTKSSSDKEFTKINGLFLILLKIKEDFFSVVKGFCTQDSKIARMKGLLSRKLQCCFRAGIKYKKLVYELSVVL